MLRVIYRNSYSGAVDETEYASSVQLTYNELLRDEEDRQIARFVSDRGFWIRLDGTCWTDIAFEA